MHASASRWLALLAGMLFWVSPAAATDVPAAMLERCLPRLDAARDVGVARILQRCPELERAFNLNPAAFGLPRDWREVGREVSADSLRELAQLLRAADEPAALAPAVAPPSAATLAAVLADWSLPDDAGPLQRLLRWIRARVGVDELPLERDAQPAARQADGLLARLWPVFGWLAFAVTLGLVGWVLSREARAAGWLPALRRRRAAPAAPGDTPAAAGGNAASLAAAQVLQDRPEWWLAQLAARLAERGALRHPHAATAREIAAAATVGPAGTQRLELLAEVAESARYAPQPPSQARLAAAAAAGVALLEELR
jgi:hypothetical protein